MRVTPVIFFQEKDKMKGVFLSTKGRRSVLIEVEAEDRCFRHTDPLERGCFNRKNGVKSFLLTNRIVLVIIAHGKTLKNPISRSLLPCHLPWQ